MHAGDVIELLKRHAGLSDRQITDALFGLGKPQQATNQLCRRLERSGVLIRRKRSDGIIENFIPDGSASGPFVRSAKQGLKMESPLIPPELSQKARELGKLWAERSHRPRVGTEMKRHWDKLIDDWIADLEMPLPIRKMGRDRGTEVPHASGRKLVFTDNSPAQWAFNCALNECAFNIDNLRHYVRDRRIPFAFTALSGCGVHLNSDGWKLCHIRPVGLGTRTPVQTLDLETLKNHSRLLLSPSNHFLVPKSWSGLGEIPEVIEEICIFENSQPS